MGGESTVGDFCVLFWLLDQGVQKCKLLFGALFISISSKISYDSAPCFRLHAGIPPIARSHQRPLGEAAHSQAPQGPEEYLEVYMRNMQRPGVSKACLEVFSTVLKTSKKRFFCNPWSIILQPSSNHFFDQPGAKELHHGGNHRGIKESRGADVWRALSLWFEPQTHQETLENHLSASEDLMKPMKKPFKTQQTDPLKRKPQHGTMKTPRPCVLYFSS